MGQNFIARARQFTLPSLYYNHPSSRAVRLARTFQRARVTVIPQSLYAANGTLESGRKIMSRRKTSVSVDDKLWREWISFVVDETGSGRKVSEETEKAIREYMQRRKEGKK